jgi:hypothetical protein
LRKPTGNISELTALPAKEEEEGESHTLLNTSARPSLHLSLKNCCSWAAAVNAQHVIPRLTRKSQGVSALWRRFLGQDAWHGRARWPRSCIEGRNHVGVLVDCAVRKGGREDGLVYSVRAVLMLCIIFPFPVPFPFPFPFPRWIEDRGVDDEPAGKGLVPGPTVERGLSHIGTSVGLVRPVSRENEIEFSGGSGEGAEDIGSNPIHFIHLLQLSRRILSFLIARENKTCNNRYLGIVNAFTYRAARIIATLARAHSMHSPI